MRFTSELTFKVLSDSGERLTLLLHLPHFVWSNISPESGLDAIVEPVFYVDDQPPINETLDKSYLRSGIEAACEELWSIYADLVESGFPDQVIRTILPANLMFWGTVTFTQRQVQDFVAAHRQSSVHELALVAHGFERALTDGTQGHSSSNGRPGHHRGVSDIRDARR